MLTNKQWKIQSLSERMNNLAVSIAAESARQAVQRQRTAKEQAIIAEETRSLAARLFEAVENSAFKNLNESDFDTIVRKVTERASFLALNTAFVSCRLPELYPVTVFAEELLNLWRELSEALGDTVVFTDIPMPSPRSRVIPDVFYMLRATSGEVTWCENAQLVIEVLEYCPDYIHGGKLIINNEWRNMDMPFITLGDVPCNPGIIIISDAQDRNIQYAVHTSVSVHGLANSYVGINKSYSGSFPVRECWSASDGSDLIFPDWERLLP